MEIKQFLTDQISINSQLLKGHQRRANTFSFIRICIFVCTGFGMYLLSPDSFLVILTFVAGALTFLWAVGRHQQINYRKALTEEIIALNKEEINRSKGILPAGSTGAAFLDPEHPFASDLDLFGGHSLFHHLSRCSLQASEELLASVLLHPDSKNTVVMRQEGTKELFAALEWVQSFQAMLRLLSKKKKDTVNFDVLRDIKYPSLNPLVPAIVLGLVSVAAVVLTVLAVIPLASLLAPVIINYGVMARYQSSIMKTGLKTDQLFKHIQVYLSALQRIHDSTFQSRLLHELRGKVDDRTIRQIRSLQRTLHWMDSRGNMFYGAINAFLLIDLHLFQQLLRWTRRNETHVSEWFGVVHGMEVYCSMASFYAHNQDFSFPEVEEEGITFESTALGHPLLPSGHRVVNDFAITAEKCYLITGSNMSGKSTFLRTVALGIVMARVGLPVCAQKLRVSAFKVYTSMRTQDNLSENTSSFYAELKRIRGLLELVGQTDMPVFYFLDEILKGTNSSDRHTGAKALIARLIQKYCVGFISTHDLELADEFENHDRVRNYSFESSLKGEKLVFDYRLHEGKCRTTNASLLMRNMGII